MLYGGSRWNIGGLLGNQNGVREIATGVDSVILKKKLDNVLILRTELAGWTDRRVAVSDIHASY